MPFAFVGVLKIDLETGKAILEPRDRSEEQLAAACETLTGGEPHARRRVVETVPKSPR